MEMTSEWRQIFTSLVGDVTSLVFSSRLSPEETSPIQPSVSALTSQSPETRLKLACSGSIQSESRHRLHFNRSSKPIQKHWKRWNQICARSGVDTKTCNKRRSTWCCSRLLSLELSLMLLQMHMTPRPRNSFAWPCDTSHNLTDVILYFHRSERNCQVKSTVNSYSHTYLICPLQAIWKWTPHKLSTFEQGKTNCRGLMSQRGPDSAETTLLTNCGWKISKGSSRDSPSKPPSLRRRCWRVSLSTPKTRSIRCVSKKTRSLSSISSRRSVPKDLKRRRTRPVQARSQRLLKCKQAHLDR